MTYIFYYNILNFRNKLSKHLRQLPAGLQFRLSKYRNRQDAARSLAGRLLLQEGLKIIGFNNYKITDLKYSSYQRPYFDHSFDFNIAHSGNYAVLALSTTNKVGIDIEEIKPTVLKDFLDYFTAPEWSRITTAENSLQEFYTLWTQKEATIKASGEGLSIPLKEIHIQQEKAMLGDKTWSLSPLQLDPAYVSYVATDLNAPELVVRQIAFD